MRFLSSADMRQGVVVDPQDVALELAHTNEQIEKGSELLVRYSEQLAQLEPELALQEARARLRADGKSQDLRDAQVRQATEDLYREVMVLRAKVRLIRDTQRDLRAELSAVQSIGAGVRSAMFSDPGIGGSGSRDSRPSRG